MEHNDPRRHKGFPDLPILLTLESWDGEEHTSSFMPEVPKYSNKAIELLWENYPLLPSGYSMAVYLYGDDCEARVDAQVILPSFNEQEARSLADRLEKFIEAEISIIQNGY